VEGSSTESSASFINLYWAPKVMRASSFLFLRCSGGEMAGESQKPGAFNPKVAAPGKEVAIQQVTAYFMPLWAP